MPAKAGRPHAEDPKRRQVGFRLDDSISAPFDAAVEAARLELPAGTRFTASDYLRGLFLRDAEARGLVPPRDEKPKKRAPRR